MQTASIVVATGLLVLAACRQADDRPVPSRAPAPASADARQPAATVVADGPPPLRLDDGVMAADPLNADATALGASLEVRLVRQLQGRNGTTRRFNLLLVVSGTGTLVVPIDGEGFGQDGESGPEDVPAGTLLAVAPVKPPAVWDDGDPIDAPIPVGAPLLYRVSFHIPGGNDDVAVVRDRERLKVFYFWEDGGSHATAWELQAEVRLAPGAELRVR